VHKLQKKTGFTVTQPNRAAYCVKLQKHIFAAEGKAANDLKDGEDGCGGERVVRRKKVAGEGGGGAGSGKRRKVEVDAAGFEYFSDEIFQIEGLLEKRMVPC